MRIDWYFDFVSPFAYLQWQRLKVAPWREDIVPRPMLFAALLGRMEQRGPAEIPRKREFTYRHAQFRADRAGIRMRFPPAHPFNPLAALRLCVAAGNTPTAIDAIFDHLWHEGLRGDDAQSLAPVAVRLGITDPSQLATAEVKSALQSNFDEAVAQQVFGVPTLAAGGELFWGEDATDLFEAWLADPALFAAAEMQRLGALPVGAARKP